MKNILTKIYIHPFTYIVLLISLVTGLFKELITFLKDRSLKIQQQNKIKDFLLNVTFLQPFLKKGFLKKPNFCPSENLFLDNYFLIFNKEKYNVITIIGDGAMTGGQAYEGLDNAGNFKSNFIILLNDNVQDPFPLFHILLPL